MPQLFDTLKHEIVKVTLAIGLANMATNVMQEFYQANKHDVHTFIANSKTRMTPNFVDLMRYRPLN